MIKATIIADSINQYGNRLTTYILTFPRIVLAEFNTHRALSRNSASSRAIPFPKMVEMVKENPFIPIAWMKEHKGMQGDSFITDPDEIQYFVNNHLDARDYAVFRAEAASKRGLTKQICNRYLEPFMWHTAIVTGTDWDNFFALRAHQDAEIHIADLAYKMLSAYNLSYPKLLQTNELHIPFGDKMDMDRLIQLADELHIAPNDFGLNSLRAKIATARCARVSYLNFDGTDNYFKDIVLHDRLVEQGHWSPFEHVAYCMHNNSYYGNFKGWHQYRKMFHNENKRDGRITEKFLANR